MQTRVAAYTLLAALLAGMPGRGASADKEGPQEKPRAPAVKVTVDVTEVPDLADWGKEAKALVEKWHPLIADLLRSDGFTPPGEVKIVFKKKIDATALLEACARACKPRNAP